HTRSKRDWSSDVCSSDLEVEQVRRSGDDSPGDDDVAGPSGPGGGLIRPGEAEESGAAGAGAQDDRGRDRGGRDTDDLDRPGRDLAAGQCAEMSAQPLGGPGFADVVDRAQCPGGAGDPPNGRPLAGAF